MTRVEAVGAEQLADLERLFGSDPIADGCWCMWHITRVADFHAAGREGNRRSFLDLMDMSHSPMGLIAYDNGAPIGWCAAGPRSRYVRALAAPTLRARERDEDDSVWLVPCFFVFSGSRRSGVSRSLLAGAVDLAQAYGAKAIEGFPDAAGKSVERGLPGRESAFAACGFSVVSRPSGSRVIMRRELA